MAYRALYREYRCRKFGEIIGQGHITTVLRHQVATGHISHAYLLCGTRGTGKTSTARILAAAVNCLAPEEGEPCGACAACLMPKEEGVDIIEIDAASNSKVDEMRDLLEKVPFSPLHHQYKVYIIDEVHMLSPSAFNALLKTLEEPPAHVVFILATTEPNKVPATIISRCQRFDFHRLSTADIVLRLGQILQGVGASVDEAGLRVIARAANGGMRDAISLLDQVLSFCGGTVAEGDVLAVLGSVDQDVLFDTVEALITGDAKAAMALVDRTVSEGRDLGVFLRDLIAHYRALALALACGDCPDLLDCTPDAMARYLDQARRTNPAAVLRGLERLALAHGQLKWQPMPRVLIETTLLQLCRPEDEMSLLALEERLARLEAALQSAEKALATVPAQAAPATQSFVQTETQPAAPAQQAQARAISPAALSADSAIPAPSPAPAADGQALWAAFLAALQKESMPLCVMARSADSITCQGSTITATFTRTALAAGLNKPQNRAVLDRVAAFVDPDLKVVILEAGGQDASLARARELFGDQLELLD